MAEQYRIILLSVNLHYSSAYIGGDKGPTIATGERSHLSVEEAIDFIILNGSARRLSPAPTLMISKKNVVALRNRRQSCQSLMVLPHNEIQPRIAGEPAHCSVILAHGNELALIGHGACINWRLVESFFLAATRLSQQASFTLKAHDQMARSPQTFEQRYVPLPLGVPIR